MRYAPRSGELPVVEPPELSPSPEDASVAVAVAEAATDLWDRVLADARVSDGFKALVPAEQAVIARWRTLAQWLPRDGV